MPAANTLDVQIAGPNPGTGFDQVAVGASATLAGTLQVELVNGFVPALNQTFTVVSTPGSGAIAGTFYGLPDGATLVASGYLFQISYARGMVTLTNIGAANATTLQQVIAHAVSSGQTPTVTVTASDPTSGQAAADALAGVTAPVVNGSTVPITNTLNLVSGTYKDLQLSTSSSDVTLIVTGPSGSLGTVNGTTIVGNSPAIVVTGGNVTFQNVTFTTATDAPTILVTGGNLTLRNCIVQESTGYSDAAIKVTGGSVDLGTAASPGGNTINVNGPGQLVANAGLGLVTAVGDTFEVNGAAITPVATVAVASSSSSSAFNQPVTLTATVSKTSSTAASPTGTVTFVDTTIGTTLATVALSSGSAQCTVATLPVNSQTIAAIYSGDGNYITSSATMVQYVNKATPSIAWPVPAAITYGTALGSAQLNATANVLINGSAVSVPGTFAFTPASGTVLHAGNNQTLAVTFTPTDTADYNSTTGSTTINVLKALLMVTAKNQTRVYGAPNPSFSVGYAGFVNGDTSASLGGTLAFGTPATINSPVGSYAITPSGLTSTNYAITFVPGTLSVTLPPNSVYVLNSSASGALTMSANAAIRLPGTLIVDSSSTSAISANSNALVAATGGVLVTGGVQKNGNAQVTKTGTPGATGDPLANLAAPTPPTSTGAPVSENISGNTVATINPGLYSQITVSGNAKLTLNPGVYVVGTGGVNVSLNATLTGNGVTYILEGGSFTVSGNASVSGSNVLIVAGGSNYFNFGVPGQSYGSVNLSGNGSFNLSAATTGDYAGILIYQTRDNSHGLSLSGNGIGGLTGLIYAPNALLTLSGNATMQNPLVVGLLSLSGNVVLA